MTHAVGMSAHVLCRIDAEIRPGQPGLSQISGCQLKIVNVESNSGVSKRHILALFLSGRN